MYAGSESSRSRLPYSTPACGPKNLYAEHTTKSASSVCTSIAACGAKCTASTYASAPTLCARKTMSAARVIVPTAFEAQPNATSFVFGPRASSRDVRSSEASSGRMSTVLTVSPRSFASSSHGSTFAWWSRLVTTISSPGDSVAPIDRLRWSVSVVMLAPNLIDSGSAAPSRSAIARCASWAIASFRSLVANAPPAFAFDSR